MRAAFALLALVLPPLAAQTIKLLPLGDSITFGCGSSGLPGGAAACDDDAGGYRVPLVLALSQVAWGADGRLNFTTVGQQTTGPSAVPEDWRRHEGYPGYRIDQACVD